MTDPVYGRDSLGVPTSIEKGVRAYGFYPYVWTAEQVAGLKVEGVYPIVVPGGGLPDNRWWTGNVRQYLAELLHNIPLKLPELCPVELDLEEGQVEQMSPMIMQLIGHTWVELCLGGKPQRIPYVYGGELVMGFMPPAIRKHIARWDFEPGQAPNPPPTAPPPGFAARQYAGNISTPGGLEDLDVFAQGLRFATPDLSHTVVIGPRPARIP